MVFFCLFFDLFCFAFSFFLSLITLSLYKSEIQLTVSKLDWWCLRQNSSRKCVPDSAQMSATEIVGIAHVGVLAELCHLPHNAPGCYHFYFKEH